MKPSSLFLYFVISVFSTYSPLVIAAENEFGDFVINHPSFLPMITSPIGEQLSQLVLGHSYPLEQLRGHGWGVRTLFDQRANQNLSPSQRQELGQIFVRASKRAESAELWRRKFRGEYFDIVQDHILGEFGRDSAELIRRAADQELVPFLVREFKLIGPEGTEFSFLESGDDANDLNVRISDLELHQFIFDFAVSDTRRKDGFYANTPELILAYNREVVEVTEFFENKLVTLPAEEWVPVAKRLERAIDVREVSRQADIGKKPLDPNEYNHPRIESARKLRALIEQNSLQSDPKCKRGIRTAGKRNSEAVETAE